MKLNICDGKVIHFHKREIIISAYYAAINSKVGLVKLATFEVAANGFECAKVY